MHENKINLDDSGCDVLNLILLLLSGATTLLPINHDTVINSKMTLFWKVNGTTMSLLNQG